MISHSKTYGFMPTQPINNLNLSTLMDDSENSTNHKNNIIFDINITIR